MIRKAALLTVIVVGIPMYWLIAGELRAAGLVLNLTRSVPIGIYQRSAIAQYAALCPSHEVLAPALAAGLKLDSGVCPNTGLEPILKPLYQALMDDPIRLGAEGFYVHGRLLPNTAPKMFSAAGKPLTHYEFGTYHSGMWAISDYNSSSYDSRYFGPVDEMPIYFYAEPLLTTERFGRR